MWERVATWTEITTRGPDGRKITTAAHTCPRQRSSTAAFCVPSSSFLAYCSLEERGVAAVVRSGGMNLDFDPQNQNTTSTTSNQQATTIPHNYTVTDMLGVYTHPESNSRIMLRRSLLDKTANGRSDMSIGLEEMSRMASEQSLGGPRDALRKRLSRSHNAPSDISLGMEEMSRMASEQSMGGPRDALRKRLSRSHNAPSDMSLGMDDLGMNRASMEPSPLGGGREAGFSLGCWDRQNGIRGFNFTDEEGGEDDEFGSDLDDEDDGTSPTNSPYINSYEDKPWHFPDRDVRKVRFDTYPETHIIDRVEPEDYPLVFYGVHELQKMADEYAAEEQQERGNYLASLRLND
jgi:hypothetical protein